MLRVMLRVFGLGARLDVNGCGAELHFGTIVQLMGGGLTWWI